MKGTAILAHGGGPTAVINASLAGVIDEAKARGLHLQGARFGVRGLLEDDFIDLSAQPEHLVEAIRYAPGSALGSSRQEIRPEQFESLFSTLKRREVRYFFYNGGNGSMHTAMCIEEYARRNGYELNVVGIPKTIDNDLAETDHTPGYGSAARFFAHAVRDIDMDNRALPSPVCVIESLGRNAGWIAASTALARHRDDDGPHLICFPERPVNEDELMSRIESVYRRLGRAVVVSCEGQMNDRGQPFGADVDRAGSELHRLASNLGHSLAKLITSRTGLRARAEKPGLFGRSCAAFASEVDRNEAYECGRAAVRAATKGESGVMVALSREDASKYRCSTTLVALEAVARRERLLPSEWIGDFDVMPQFLDYVRPLVGAIEPHAKLAVTSTNGFEDR